MRLFGFGWFLGYTGFRYRGLEAAVFTWGTDLVAVLGLFHLEFSYNVDHQIIEIFLVMIPRHQGQRFIIGGSSEYLLKLPISLLDTGIVIGLNHWPSFMERMDYWLCLDTDFFMHNHADMVYSIKAPRFMQQYEHVPDAPGDYWFKRQVDPIPTTWEEKLSWFSTCACAAANLAGIMGASEVLLYGVDLIPGGRANGTRYEEDDHWSHKAKRVSEWMQRCSEAFEMPIYKLNPDSPLDLPLASL